MSCSVIADQPKWQEGVVTQKIGSEFLFVFPTNNGNVVAQAKSTGRILIGRNIEILYAIKIMAGSSNARFIALDASKLTPTIIKTIHPDLRVENEKSVGLGFYVRDSSQKELQFHMNPKFIHDVKSATDLQEKVGREGNLNVVIGKGDKFRFRVVKVEIN